MVEEDEGATRPLFIAQCGNEFAERYDAGGVVVDSVRIGRAKDKDIKDQREGGEPAEHDSQRSEYADPDQTPGQQPRCREEGDEDQ